MKRITETKYNKARDTYLGWCKKCEAFTREHTEPDAFDYDCPKCKEHMVMGAEMALIEGWFMIKGG
jgi:Zn finger protein HypA/HybF involved in hydrogenase expression